MSEFVEEKSPGRWTISKPKIFKPGEMIARAVAQFRGAESDPMLMGRSPGVHPQPDLALVLPRFGGVFFSAHASLRDPVLRWSERIAESAEWRNCWRRCPNGCLRSSPQAVACSEFIAAALLRDPAALAWLVIHDDPASPDAPRHDHERLALAAENEAEAKRLLRVWRRREMLRIAWCKLVGRTGGAEILRALSRISRMPPSARP